MSRTVVDDLGTAVTVPDACRRVVSLVPSITESIAETDRDALVGATQWCEFPTDLDVTRVRGTKNPDWKAIVALRPDLVVVNQEENREIDVRRLRDAGVPVWVTRIESVDDALASLSRMFTDALGWPVPEWLEQAELAWQAPAELDGPRVAAVIWRNPWMVVGRDTFSGDVLERLGCVNAFADADSRYPTVEAGTLDALGLNADCNLLGPGNRANACIGRAVNLVLRNVGECRPGEFDMSTLGQPAKYTCCIAENVAASPWPALHVERGFAADESVVTPGDCRTLLDAGGTQVVNIKLMKSGLSGALEIIGMCRSAGVTLMLGCMVESGIGTGAAVHLACGTGAFTWLDLDAPLLLARDIAEGAYTLNGSIYRVSDAPGLGARLVPEEYSKT